MTLLDPPSVEAVPDIAPAPVASMGEIASLKRRVFWAALGIAPLDIGFTGAFIAVSGRWETLPEAVAVNLAVLVALNAIGLWWLLRPLDDLSKDVGPRSARKARRRAARLGLIVPAWTFLLGIVYCASIFVTAPYVKETAEDIDNALGLSAFVWFAFVYGFYFAFYAYFATADVISTHRRRGAIASDGVLRQPMAFKFALVAFALAVMPTAQILQDLTWLAPIRTAQGLAALDAVVLDLMATSIAAALSLFFVGRSLLRPIDSLVEGLGHIAAGRFGTRLPPLSDDEMGELAMRFNDMSDGLRERQRIEGMFSKYVAPSVARSLLSDSRDGSIRTEEQVATSLFTDIAGFTALTEGMDPDRAVDMLNAYFTAISAPITAEGGAIVNLTGDGLHAVFNVPYRQKGHANAAVRAALEIQRLVATHRFGEDAHLKTRIGIHTGRVVAGSVGCDDRLHYTVYGDSVNIASRLEGLNKEFGTDILISEAVRDAMGEEADDISMRRRPDVRIRGRGAPLTLYELRPWITAEEAADLSSG
jgi:class 3 adenylate cyclase